MHGFKVCEGEGISQWWLLMNLTAKLLVAHYQLRSLLVPRCGCPQSKGVGVPSQEASEASRRIQPTRSKEHLHPIECLLRLKWSIKTQACVIPTRLAACSAGDRWLIGAVDRPHDMSHFWLSKTHVQQLFLILPSQSCKLSSGKLHCKRENYNRRGLFQKPTLKARKRKSK